MTEIAGLVLVVDDDGLNRTLLTTNLQQQGYIVASARDGKQALELLHGQPFDVVLLDLLMPEMDGYQVLERMKQDPVLRHLPVIVISALDEMESVIRCIEMGATDYLPKPFDPILLRARLNASLSSKRLHDIEQAHLKAIQVERERADRLLLNILPAPIAEQLKQGREKIAESFNDVTVLFADVVDFTPWAATRSPGEVLDVLNAIFSTFDRLADQYGLEKIKTIGDCYMVAGGVPVPRPDHAEAMAEMALDMRSEFNSLPVVCCQDITLRLRTGMHSGPVIAGVIGQKKFIYDMWGDTVNTASRMQTHGTANEIQVSENTYARLCHKFEFQGQGVIQVKGKGEMHTYMLIGRKVL
jgi:class 3 adenylate cyclase